MESGKIFDLNDVIWLRNRKIMLEFSRKIYWKFLKILA